MFKKVFQKLAGATARRSIKAIDAISPHAIVDGIKIVDYFAVTPCDDAGDNNSPSFIATTTQALELIRDRDPLRYQRVKDSLSAIRSLASQPFPVYSRALRSCHLNFHAYCDHINGYVRSYETNPQKLEEFVAAELATTIIHEATHGYLMDREIGYGDGEWRAVEKRCRREEILFARKALEDVSGYDGGLMDWDYWNDFGPIKESWYEDYRELSRWEIVRHRHNLLWRNDQGSSLVDFGSEIPNTIDLAWFTRHAAYLDALISNESTDVAAISDRGDRYNNAGLLNDAIADQRRALDINPHSWQSWSRLMEVLLEAGENEEVLEKSRWRYEDEPTLLHLQWMAWYQIQLKHPDGARSLKLVLQHPELENEQRDYYQRMEAICLSDAGETDAALNLLEAGWPEESCSCGLMSRQHNVLMMAGRDVDALERRETFLQFRCDSEVEFPDEFRRTPAFMLYVDRDPGVIEYLNLEAVILVGSDPRLLQDPERLQQIAAALRERMQSVYTPEIEKRYLAAAMHGSLDSCNMCYQLPTDWTDGYRVYCCSVSIHRACLRGGVLNSPLLWVMAMPLTWIMEEEENEAGFASPYVFSTETEFANIEIGKGCGILPQQSLNQPCINSQTVKVFAD